MQYTPKSSHRGFTFIELLVIIAIIGILSSIVFVNTQQVQETAYFMKAQEEFRSFNTALFLYLDANNRVYPTDANRNIPAGLEQYLNSSNVWPKATWPGSVFDWDNWDDPDNLGKKIYQISIRFCTGGLDTCQFPNQEWAQNFDTYSAVFYCISGNCRSHIDKPPDHPGYCVNCAEPLHPYGIY